MPPKLTNRYRVERPKRFLSPHFFNATSAIHARRATASAVNQHALSIKLLTSLRRAREARHARLKLLRKQSEASKRRCELIAIKIQHHAQTSASSSTRLSSPPSSEPQVLVSINHVAECRAALTKLTTVVAHALTTLSSLAEKPPTSTLWSDFTTILESSKFIAASRLIIVATQESRVILTQAGIVIPSTSPQLQLFHGRVLLAAFAIVHSPIEALRVEPTDFNSSEFGTDFIYGSRPTKNSTTTTNTRNVMAVIADARALVGATLALAASAQNFTSTKRRNYTAAIIPRDTSSSILPVSLNLDTSPFVSPRLRVALSDNNGNAIDSEAPARCVHALGAFFHASDAFSVSFKKWKMDEVRNLVSPLSDLYRSLLQRRAIIDLESSRPFADQDEGLTQLREGINKHLVKVRSAAVRALGGERSEAARLWLSRVEPKKSQPSPPTLQTSSPPTLPVIVPPAAPRSPLRSPLRDAEPRTHVPDLISHLTRNLDLIHTLCIDENFTIPLPIPPSSLNYEGFNEGTSPSVIAGESE